MATKAENKFRSRTFWFTVAWNSFIPLSLLVQAFINVELPVESIIQFAGLLTLAYVSGNKVIDWAKVKMPETNSEG